jgi:phosphatidylglycerol:prolipoprotein diacylglycerol transferase
VWCAVLIALLIRARFDHQPHLGQLKAFVHPIAFQVGSLTITWYGVMVATAFLVGLWTASRRAVGSGIPPEKVLDLGPWLIVGTIIGARALFVISYWREQFAGQPLAEIFMVWRGGLVYYGGLIGATLAGVIYARLKRLPLWKLADVVAPSIALGCVFGRIGCLMNGCCYGLECNWPWAIHFPYGHHTYPHGVHPTQVYDSLLNLVLYCGLAWMYRRKKFDGEVFAAYLIGYAIFRSFVEMFRGDYPQHYLGGWATPAQLVSVGILALGLILWLVLPKFPTQSTQRGG